jgi:hypothetical protein
MNTLEDAPCELDFRSENGVEVTLFWWRQANHLAVSVVDESVGNAFVIPVGDAPPLEVFKRPYAHAARRGVV